jgi:hypothetical protein
VIAEPDGGHVGVLGTACLDDLVVLDLGEFMDPRVGRVDLPVELGALAQLVGA